MEKVPLRSLAYALRNNDQDQLKRHAMIIAKCVRDDIEDFHVKHLTDEQMKELNFLTRNAIYNALFLIANADKNEKCAEIVLFLDAVIPKYWEAPDLEKSNQEILDEMTEATVTFQSEFLTQQLKIGNITAAPEKGIVVIEGAHAFNGVKYNDRKKHKNKIIYELKKENYIYDNGLMAYKKITGW